MDYAFAPDPKSKAGKRLFQRKNNTTLIHKKGIRSIKGFLEHLRDTQSISKPIGDLWILSHGNVEGSLQIDLSGKKSIRIDYDVLEKAISDNWMANTEVLVQKPDGTNANITVHIRGCRVGMSMPFMQKLKEAFNIAHSVTAPKHSYGIEERSSHGSFELLSQVFHINSNKKLTREGLIEAYKKYKNADTNAGFSYFNNTSVPEDKWDKWIPSNINANRKDYFSVNLGQSIGKLDRLRIPREYRYRQSPPATWTIPNVSVKPSDSESKNKLRDSLANDVRFQPEYPNPQNPYPFYQRYGYPTLNEFINGWKWKFNWISNYKKLKCIGIRHEHEIIIPITNPPTDLDNGQLLFNFYPKAGTAFVSVENLLENDTNLFTTK